MNSVNDFLFVIGNYQGKKEHNMLSTKNEFLSFLNYKGLSGFVADVDFLLDNETSCYSWKSINTLNGLIEFRRCKDEQDLCRFLDGRYNDSPDKMFQRGLHGFTPFDSFDWDLKRSSISPISISILSSLKEKNPLLNKYYQNIFDEKKSLNDIIDHCTYKQKSNTKNSQNYSRNMLEI